MSENSKASPLLAQVAEGLGAVLCDPRRLAEELIEKELGDTPLFMGEGRKGCPWIVFSRDGGLHALYVRDRELVQMANGRPDEVVRNL